MLQGSLFFFSCRFWYARKFELLGSTPWLCSPSKGGFGEKRDFGAIVLARRVIFNCEKGGFGEKVFDCEKGGFGEQGGFVRRRTSSSSSASFFLVNRLEVGVGLS